MSEDTKDTKELVKEHELQAKVIEKKPGDPITITRGGIEVKGLRKDEEQLIEELLRMEKENGN